MPRTAEEIIHAVNLWQKKGDFHPLTCGNNSDHKILEAVELHGKVLLVCPDCDYVQEHIPNVVLECASNINHKDEYKNILHQTKR